ncbi:hypothetical protein HPB47_012478 [Ixodes persulcatus]|uniref:Uncharacterized protein n=1 Tax=Ixodes persulcatus TaxID=34615 RepID=A0AC60NTE5_IXOPE|nr:hypothetical protein HPB47_012478 [Ixodes persulcatus]
MVLLSRPKLPKSQDTAVALVVSKRQLHRQCRPSWSGSEICFDRRKTPGLTRERQLGCTMTRRWSGPIASALLKKTCPRIPKWHARLGTSGARYAGENCQQRDNGRSSSSWERTSARSLLDHCDPGHFVAALREEDSTWYRARVYDISKDSVHGAAQKGGSATVFYVDYGHWETMPLDGLRRLPDALLNDAAFAVPVVLHDVPALSSRAAAALQGKFVEAQVLVDERPQQVALFTTDDNVRLNDVISTFDH